MSIVKLDHSSRFALSSAALLLLLVLVAGPALVAAVDCTAVTADPLATVDFSVEPFLTCTRARCETTLGINITSSTGGYCNGNATLEAAVACGVLASAYSTFYSCVQTNLAGTAVGGAAYQSELIMYRDTPGVPYSFTNLSCYACNHFKNEVLVASGSACSTLTCAQCCAGQSPFATTPGSPGKGYNQVLCGNGCIAALMMIPFTFVSLLMFLCCCCNWPSPALKATAARVKAEEEAAERAARHPHGSDAEKDGGDDAAEDEAPTRDRDSHHQSNKGEEGADNADEQAEQQAEREPFNEVDHKENEH